MHKDNQEQSWICFICVTSNHQLTSGLFRSLLVWTPLKSTIWNVIEDNVLYSAKSRSVSSKNHLSLDGFNPAHLDPDPQRPPGQLAAAHVWLVNPDLCMALVWLPVRVTALCTEKLAAGTEGPSVWCTQRLARSSRTIRIAFFILIYTQKLWR